MGGAEGNAPAIMRAPYIPVPSLPSLPLLCRRGAPPYLPPRLAVGQPASQAGGGANTVSAAQMQLNQGSHRRERGGWEVRTCHHMRSRRPGCAAALGHVPDVFLHRTRTGKLAQRLRARGGWAGGGMQRRGVCVRTVKFRRSAVVCR